MKHSFILALLLTFGTAVSGLAQSPRFTKITPGPDGSVSLTLTGAVLTSYTILATTDLKSPFSPLGVLVTDQNGTGSFTDPGTTIINQKRFYRAQQTALGATSTNPPVNSTPPLPVTSQNQQTAQATSSSPPALQNAK